MNLCLRISAIPIVVIYLQIWKISCVFQKKEVVILNTEIANAVNAARDKARYDMQVKRLLSQKMILAHILVKTVDEFKGMKAEDAVFYIEGEPKVGIVPLEPGLTNIEEKLLTGQRIVGFNTENGEINEGMIRFDIIFYVHTKNGLSQIIVNIECQKDESSGYEILNRAIFYVSRLVSSQKERDFVNMNYDDIKQVFSIWICMNMEQNSLSHIHLKKDELLSPCKWKGNLNLLNIVMVGIADKIPQHDEDYELHRLLGTLLSDRMKEKEKLEIIEDEYNIPISSEYREEVKAMSNFGDWIEEKATERATEETTNNIIMNMYESKFSLEQISLATKKSVEEIEKIISENQLLMV